MININLKYFGMAAEAINKESEVLELNTVIDLAELKQHLYTVYPKIKDIKFQIAVNQEVVDEQTKLNNNDEAAVLPPFAGG